MTKLFNTAILLNPNNFVSCSPLIIEPHGSARLSIYLTLSSSPVTTPIILQPTQLPHEHGYGVILPLNSSQFHSPHPSSTHLYLPQPPLLINIVISPLAFHHKINSISSVITTRTHKNLRLIVLNET